MDEALIDLLAARLRTVLAEELPPDAAGSRSLALAILAAQAAAELPTAERPAFTLHIHLLPAFISHAQDSGCEDDLQTLVRRFAHGERLPVAPTQPTPAAAEAVRRRARLRELRRWGVDLSLIETTLAQTPTVRIANMERQLLLVRKLQDAKRAQEAS